MGPLHGIKIIELAGIGPGPMTAMLLADMGATVLRIERKDPVDLGVKRELKYNLLLRNRQCISLDLKNPGAVALVLRLVENADALIEGFRPGVTERLGLGPDACLACNPRLVYGRITGWGQEGPLAHAAGHDINYIALTGVLDAIGRHGQPPSVPLALLGDFGGGALYLALGMLAALLEAGRSGQGQVVDAAIVDGVASMATAFFGLAAAGTWRPERGSNILDSGAPFYDVYACSDGKWISIGPIEGRFFKHLLRALDIGDEIFPAAHDHLDPTLWSRLRAVLAERFRGQTRQAWCEQLEGLDVCFAPVLSLDEAPQHPHLKARATFIDIEGVTQPAPAPRFSRSAALAPHAPRAASPDTFDDALQGWLSAAELAALKHGL